MTDPITLTFGILGAGIQLARVIGNVQHVISSKEEARELRRQLRYLNETIDEVRSTLRRLGGLVPRNLSDIIHALGQYCRLLGDDIARFHLRFRNKGSFRFMNWIAMTAGFNKIERYRDRLEDCENWYSIALNTLHLTVSQEVRARSPSNIPAQITEQDILRGSQEIQSKNDLRRHLSRIRRSRNSRYQRMRRAGIDLNGLGNLAEDVLDDPTTAGTRSTGSLPRPQRPAPQNLPRPQNHQLRTQTRTRREIPETVPISVQDFIYSQPSPDDHPQVPRNNYNPQYYDQPQQPVQAPARVQMPQSFPGIVQESLYTDPRTPPPVPRPQPPRNNQHQRQYHHHSEGSGQGLMHTQLHQTVPALVQDDVMYNHSPLSVRRRDGVLLHEQPMQERGPIRPPPPSSYHQHKNPRQQHNTRGRPRSIGHDSFVEEAPQPLRRQRPDDVPIRFHPTAERGPTQPHLRPTHHPHEDRMQYRSPTRSRSRSIDHDSGIEDADERPRPRRPGVEEKRYPPTCYRGPEERPGKPRKRSRSRADSGYGSISGLGSNADDHGSMRSESSSWSRQSGSRNHSTHSTQQPSEGGSQPPEYDLYERRRRRRERAQD
ncbi:uncharacterized protein PAC_04880 [Phialocephala subalpina]|uniref:Fungal N-terminal domain-containing protein n=1 Tax=Phialocephala subalpina TaxID=576137 RepID=A0A1L7WQF5_9HELO|nr:uncharacterized protein PAC_04880 [Phialocephala subalpina]